MASLKEIKVRIGSVKSTWKITSAMKMIASSKLHKAQASISNFLPYQRKLDAILNNLLASETSSDSPFVKKRQVKRVAIVAFASNSSLCGAYNANVKKEIDRVYRSYAHLGDSNIELYAVGKKLEQHLQKEYHRTSENFQHIADKPEFKEVEKLAKTLKDKYLSGNLDEIMLIYHHFKSTGTQLLTTSKFLPFVLEVASESGKNTTSVGDYIYEPGRIEVLNSLIPTVLNTRLFAATLDSVASEHAARMMAMQVASENANELIHDLTIQFNKTRQQAVTNELLDIIGGASAL